MNTSRGRYLTELRRSSAAGIHASKPTRTAERKAAIEEEIDMFFIDGHLENDYEDRYHLLDDIEPDDDEIFGLEEELLFDDDDWLEDDIY